MLKVFARATRGIVNTSTVRRFESTITFRNPVHKATPYVRWSPRTMEAATISAGPPPSTYPQTENTLPEKRKAAFPTASTNPKRPQHNRPRGDKKQRSKPVKEGGAEDVLNHDISDVLAARTPEEAAQTPERLDLWSEVDLPITSLSSSGDGLSYHRGRIYVVPFSLPGDTVRAKLIRHTDTHTVTDFLSVLTPSPDRDDSLINCKYFGTCGGCQYQMMPYAAQLEHKRRVIERAYKNFSEMSGETLSILPPIGNTIGSPLKWGYRTKLTPHFDGPRRGGFTEHSPMPEIGFMQKGRRKTVDIEDCPIGTDSVRAGMAKSRAYVHENLRSYKKGATLLLRESTIRTPIPEATTTEQNLAKYTEEKLCITDNNAESIEYIGDYKFISPAGQFFQNNNSILPIFTDFIRSNLALPTTSTTSSTTPPKYLVDAYCGSGLFTVTCGAAVERAIGVDISPESIEYARRNAANNGITNAKFIAGDAEKIFADIDFPGSETACILDPSRKGCDHLFLNQLLAFRPKRIVYVSCNVHTQARDLGFILDPKHEARYKVDSIVGFDFFPNTHHVESVAVLTLL